jgi:hypothetical protein
VFFWTVAMRKTPQVDGERGNGTDHFRNERQ